MRRNLLNTALLFLILLPWGVSFAQINQNGIPFITNYSHKIYNAAETNYSVTRDNRGVMYFGNEESILEYDGKNWTKIPVPNQTFILSLATAPNGRVYAGGVNDFGHLVPDNRGQLVYQSLAHLLKDKNAEITRVWKIYTNNELVYFCTGSNIFLYNTLTQTIKNINLPKGSLWSFFAEETLYTSNINKGLLKLANDTIITTKGGGFYADGDIFSILEWNTDTLLISSTNKGLTLYCNTNGTVLKANHISSTAQQTSNTLRENNIYASVKIDNNRFAYGTLGNGLYIINKQGEIETHINTELGLPSESVSNLYYSKHNPTVLWLTLDNGIISVNVSSPIKQFGTKAGLNGKIYDITKHKNELYVSSSVGVFKQIKSQNNNTSFYQIEGFGAERVYALQNIKTGKSEKLIAASDRDIYEIIGKKAYPLKINLEIYRLTPSNANPNQIYLATSKGISVLTSKQNKIVLNKKPFAVTDEMVNKITEDKHGNLWCNTLTKPRVYDKLGNQKAIPESIENEQGDFFVLNNELYFTNGSKVLLHTANNNTFKLDQDMCKLLTSGEKKLKEVFPLDTTTAVAYFETDETKCVSILRYSNNQWTIDSSALNIIPPMTTQSVKKFGNFIHIGGQDGLFIYDNNISKDFKSKPNTIIRSITIGVDSVIYKGADDFFESTEQQQVKVAQLHTPIKFRHNNIKFEFTSPFFEEESSTVYSSYLEGFNKTWSPWVSENTNNYTNLNEGTYRFHVKSKNIYGTESNEAIFEFRILPPWYNTWWAYIGYVIIGFAILWLSIKWYTRKLQADKERLEEIVKERTAEIVEQNKKIESQNRSITDSIRYAKRIQTAVLPDKQTCELFDYFIYFIPKDIVSGDFYWVHHFEKHNRLIFIAADCTGHGVPGAFMSMLGTSFLNEIVAKLDVNHSDSILNLLRKDVINTLSQGLKEGDRDERKDGMDMALASIDLETMIMEFSGANNPLLLIRNGELTEFKPDKMPIGAYVKQHIPFKRTEIQLQSGDQFYLFSDGYVDQFGGKHGRKYMKKRFKEYLLSISNQPMNIQKALLKEEMSIWMKNEEQIDDQLIIGVKANF
ncbi:MAG: SpoIIE family protein phosphatase [Bacteroidales bacterium]|nr:SpoIIE family protein phosphatase [Bacteroidales bacterium]